MQQHQIALIRSSWEKVLPIAAVAADIFYTKLFELDPSLRGLFPNDLSEQKVKLMATLGRVVSSLDDPTFIPAVEALGRKHVKYGVRPEHYTTVGAALLATLETGLGEAWTPEVRTAWVTAFGGLSQTMMLAGGSSRSGVHRFQLSLQQAGA
ncbi:MAG: globin family protein [Polyangiales bacterium]